MEMKTVLITGANGFVGKNLSAKLEETNSIEVLQFGSENTLEQLYDFASKSDFVIHLAGVNRPQDSSEYYEGNTVFTEKILIILKQIGRKVPVLFASSIQAELDNPYGISKKAAEEAVFKYGSETGSAVYIYRLPNIFGKWCKPNYNSVVATWCSNVSRGLPIQINNPTTEINLVYIDDVVDSFIQALNAICDKDRNGFCFVNRTFTVTLQELSDRLYAFKNSRNTLVVSDLEEDFNRFLYTTYLSYLPLEEFGYKLDMKHDNRGWLTEFIKSPHMGQIFVSRTKPGITRGNHWHHTKVEKFLVIEGRANIKFRHVRNNETVCYEVTGEVLQVLDIPPGYTHSITNTGTTDVITIFWANEIFNKEKADTYFLEV